MGSLSSEQKDLYDALLAAVQGYLRCLPDDTRIRVNTHKNPYSYLDLVPRELTVQTRMTECLALASERTRPLVHAIVNARNHLRWQQSYTVEDGFDARYLENYGWFNLISPEGPFLSEQIRVSIGFWGEDLHYNEHWHEPEEIYIVLAGSAVFQSEGRPPRSCSADDIIQHDSNQRHSIDMVPGPLLAMAIWFGQNLMRKSSL